MIRINLQKNRRERRRKIIVKRILFFSIYTITVVVLLFAICWNQAGLVVRYEDRVGKKTELLKSEMKRVKDTALLRKKIRKKESRCSKISELKGNGNFLNIIKRISRASALSGIQLSEVTIDKDEVIIEGYGFDTFKVTNFMGDIRRATDIKTARLKVVKKSVLKGFPKLRFKIICTKNT